MEIGVVIEDPRGSTVRHHWDEHTKRWIEKPHPHSATPWPANYGYVPGTFNPSDNDDLDVLVLSRDSLATGSEITVRVIGLLRRPDGDDKILGVLAGDPMYGDTTCLNDVPGPVIRHIEAWFREWSEVGEWADLQAAQERILNARELATKWKPSPRE